MEWYIKMLMMIHLNSRSLWANYAKNDVKHLQVFFFLLRISLFPKNLDRMFLFWTFVSSLLRFLSVRPPTLINAHTLSLTFTHTHTHTHPHSHTRIHYLSHTHAPPAKMCTRATREAEDSFPTLIAKVKCSTIVLFCIYRISSQSCLTSSHSVLLRWKYEV